MCRRLAAWLDRCADDTRYVNCRTEVSIATSVMPPARVRHAGLRPSPSDEDLSDAYKRDGFEEIELQVYSVNKGDSQT